MALLRSWGSGARAGCPILFTKFIIKFKDSTLICHILVVAAGGTYRLHLSMMYCYQLNQSNHHIPSSLSSTVIGYDGWGEGVSLGISGNSEVCLCL